MIAFAGLLRDVIMMVAKTIIFQTTRCSIIQDGAYPHPSVFWAQDEVRIAQLRLQQKGRNPPKFYNLSLPKAPVLPSEWKEEDKVSISWFLEVVKF